MRAESVHSANARFFAARRSCFALWYAQVDHRQVAGVHSDVWWRCRAALCLLCSTPRQRHVHCGTVWRPVFWHDKTRQFKTLQRTSLSFVVHRSMVRGKLVRHTVDPSRYRAVPLTIQPYEALNFGLRCRVFSNVLIGVNRDKLKLVYQLTLTM